MPHKKRRGKKSSSVESEKKEAAKKDICRGEDDKSTYKDKWNHEGIDLNLYLAAGVGDVLVDSGKFGKVTIKSLLETADKAGVGKSARRQACLNLARMEKDDDIPDHVKDQLRKLRNTRYKREDHLHTEVGKIFIPKLESTGILDQMRSELSSTDAKEFSYRAFLVLINDKSVQERVGSQCSFLTIIHRDNPSAVSGTVSPDSKGILSFIRENVSSKGKCTLRMCNIWKGKYTENVTIRIPKGDNTYIVMSDDTDFIHGITEENRLGSRRIKCVCARKAATSTWITCYLCREKDYCTDKCLLGDRDEHMKTCRGRMTI